MTAPAPSPIIDAEFIDVEPTPPPGARPAQGYGRRTVAGPKVEAARAVLEAMPQAAATVAGVARGLGADALADHAERAADVAARANEVAHAMPQALEAVDAGTKPLRSALGRLFDSAKKAGIVGGRRPPRKVTRSPRPQKGA